MVDRDSAFLWETEALRSVPHRPVPSPSRVKPAGGESDHWLTLREANEITGIPVPTLRKWARKDNVESYLEESAVGQLRMVSLQGVYQRAEELGREINQRPESLTDQSPSATTVPREVDLTTDEPVTRFEAAGSETPAEPEIPEGTMLVPLDAWNKMLNQLGNLHEAGQQLAEARERAAKAETEATFLKERLAEMRNALEEAQQAPSVPAHEETREEPITHIPIESDEGPGMATGEAEAIEGDGPMSFTEYSLEMLRHLFSTWKGRPRR